MIDTKSQTYGYAFAHLVHHLRKKDDLDKLWWLLEEKGFLALQARHTEGFQDGTRDLESDVLPAALEEEDWPRFLRYGLVAIRLKRIAQSLCDETLLGNLVSSGRTTMARNLRDQLADPLARARAQAVILAASSRATESGKVPGLRRNLLLLKEDLAGSPAPATRARAEDWAATLEVLARVLDPRWLREDWARWVLVLEEAPPAMDLVCDVWHEVAESWLTRDISVANGPWPELQAWRRAAHGAGRADPLPSFLPPRLAASATAAGYLLGETLPPLLEEDRELLGRCRLAVLARLVGQGDWDPAEAVACLDRFLAQATPAWLEVGGELWSRCSRDILRGLSAQLHEPAASVAVLVLALEGNPTLKLDDLIVPALEELSGALQWHWGLRYLISRPGPERPARVHHLMQALEKVRFTLPAPDLTRFLDLVAEDQESHLKEQLEKVLWAPTSTVETLRTLAVNSKNEDLVALLWERAEESAAALAVTQAEGFSLRRELLVTLTCRRISEHGVECLEETKARLLPEEEEELRLALVDALLAPQPRPAEKSLEAVDQRSEMAHEIGQGLHSRQLALLTGLRTAPMRMAELLEPVALYQAVAGTSVAEEELHALSPLLQPPLDPRALAIKHIQRVRDVDRRIQALIDLGHHTLGFQEQVFGQLDSTAASSPLLDALGSVSTGDVLVTLIPELVTLSVRTGLDPATAEIQEAILQLIQLEDVEASLCIETMASLIVGILPCFLGPTPESAPRSRRVKAARLLRWIVALAARRGLGKKIRQDIGPEILPVLLATVDRLPGAAVSRLLGRNGGKFRAWTTCLCQLEALQCLATDGGSGFRHWTRRIEEEACLEQKRRLTTLLVLLCAKRDPALAHQLLEQAPPSTNSDVLRLRLVRWGWLPDELASQTIARIRSVPIAQEAQAWLARRLGDAGGLLEALAQLVEQGDQDLFDPRRSALRRALWQNDRTSTCRALGEALLVSLARSGAHGGEHGLRCWLQNFLLSGEPQPERLSTVARAIKQARNL